MALGLSLARGAEPLVLTQYEHSVVLMSAEPVQINFTVTGSGWGTVALRIGSSTFTIDAVSYCTDVVGDLLRGALTLVTGEYFARASFDGEPHEWRLVVSSPGDGITLQCGCSIKVLEFANINESLPDKEGRLTFEADCMLGDFATAVLEMARGVMNAGGIEAYRWGNWPFPLRAFRALESALDIGDLPRTLGA